MMAGGVPFEGDGKRSQEGGGEETPVDCPAGHFITHMVPPISHLTFPEKRMIPSLPKNGLSSLVNLQVAQAFEATKPQDSIYYATLFFLLRKWAIQERCNPLQMNIRLFLNLLVLQEQHLTRILQALLPVTQHMIPERPKLKFSLAISVKCLWKRHTLHGMNLLVKIDSQMSLRY
nr:hypothetical protein SETIT_6G209000v2 [Ipomoea batatas]